MQAKIGQNRSIFPMRRKRARINRIERHNRTSPPGIARCVQHPSPRRMPRPVRTCRKTLAAKHVRPLRRAHWRRAQSLRQD